MSQIVDRSFRLNVQLGQLARSVKSVLFPSAPELPAHPDHVQDLYDGEVLIGTPEHAVHMVVRDMWGTR